MKTFILEGVVTALTSINHNGGERNGTITQLRREKFVQKNGKVESIPVISGNSIRGILRDRGMLSMLRELGYGIEKDGKINGLPLSAFYFLFSGGALTSTGSGTLDIDHFRKMSDAVPLISLFGGAAGNTIMPGKMKIGKLIPICLETEHLLPDRFVPDETLTIWEYCQTEMYTRRDDQKNDRLRPFLEKKAIEGDENKAPARPQQMKYEIESLSAGTQFYWKIVLEDVTDIEFEAFLSAILEFSKSPNIGGKGAVGHGEISIKLNKWVQVDSRVDIQGKEIDVKLGKKYQDHLKNNADKIKECLHKIQ